MNINQIKNIQKDHVILLITSIACMIGFLALIFIIFSRASTPQVKEAPTQEIEPNHSSESTLKYQSGTQGKLYDTLTSERVLADQDKRARAQIISEIGNKSGSLYSSPNVILGYLSSPDYFQAEITTNNVDFAKEEVIDWLLSKGISEGGICDLPIMFLLDENTSTYFIESKKEFNPLAPGC